MILFTCCRRNQEDKFKTINNQKKINIGSHFSAVFDLSLETNGLTYLSIGLLANVLLLCSCFKQVNVWWENLQFLQTEHMVNNEICELWVFCCVDSRWSFSSLFAQSPFALRSPLASKILDFVSVGVVLPAQC